MNSIGGLMWQLLHEHETLPICNGQWSHNFTSNSTVLSANLCANYQPHVGLILPATLDSTLKVTVLEYWSLYSLLVTELRTGCRNIPQVIKISPSVNMKLYGVLGWIPLVFPPKFFFRIVFAWRVNSRCCGLYTFFMLCFQTWGLLPLWLAWHLQLSWSWPPFNFCSLSWL